MQPRYHHSQATLSKKQAIEIAKDRVKKLKKKIMSKNLTSFTKEEIKKTKKIIN